MDKSYDKSLVKTVTTHKSGPFKFSRNYDRNKLQNQRIEAPLLYRTIVDIPILPDLASDLEQDLIKKSIFGTAAIEGNPLSQDDVNLLLSPEGATKKFDHKAEKQIKNLQSVYKMIRATRPTSAPLMLTEELVRKFHEVITTDCENPENIPGQYRNRPVKVGDEAHGGVYTPPKVLDDIKLLMPQFLEWINSPELVEDGIIRACLAHYHLALIHPFENGNGRTARAIEALLLKSAGYRYVPHMLSNYYYKRLDDYFWAFSLSERNDANDVTPFVEFYLTGTISALNEIREKLFAWIREFTLRDYYSYLRKHQEITRRQHDLLSLLLESPTAFTLKDLLEKNPFRVLYRSVSERTARRDLQYLESRKILARAQDSSYRLNPNILDRS